jgi:hypothetical protein
MMILELGFARLSLIVSSLFHHIFFSFYFYCFLPFSVHPSLALGHLLHLSSILLPGRHTGRGLHKQSLPDSFSRRALECRAIGAPAQALGQAKLSRRQIGQRTTGDTGRRVEGTEKEMEEEGKEGRLLVEEEKREEEGTKEEEEEEEGS